VDRFPDRKRAADGEQHRHDKCPEVRVHPVDERMGAIGRALAQPHPQEEEDLVAGVGDGMKRLGKHRRAAPSSPQSPL
jgi:hypothetical protein